MSIISRQYPLNTDSNMFLRLHARFKLRVIFSFWGDNSNLLMIHTTYLKKEKRIIIVKTHVRNNGRFAETILEFGFFLVGEMFQIRDFERNGLEIDVTPHVQGSIRSANQIDRVEASFIENKRTLVKYWHQHSRFS